jgi:hypothetical protein
MLEEGGTAFELRRGFQRKYEEVSMSPKKGTQKSAKSTTTSGKKSQDSRTRSEPR